MKKQLFTLLSSAILLCSCGETNSTNNSELTSITDTTSDITTQIDINSRDVVTSWDELTPYLKFALGDYYQELPSYFNREYYVSFTCSEDTVGILIQCTELRTDSAMDTYADSLNIHDFTVVPPSESAPYGYKMVSTFDCLYTQFIQEASTLSILAYYRTVRVPDWPTELSDLIVGKDMPKLEADAYFYYYQANARNFITLYIDCYFAQPCNSLLRYIEILRKAGYSISNQNEYYTAISSDGESIIQFDDYVADGTCIEISAYSYWPGLDFAYYLGFDLPRYEGENSGFETQYQSHESGASYICVFYDGVDSNCLDIYGNQLKKLGMVEDTDFVSLTSKVYYINDKKYPVGEEPWVQIAYSSSAHSLVISIPYIYNEIVEE